MIVSSRCSILFKGGNGNSSSSSVSSLVNGFIGTLFGTTIADNVVFFGLVRVDFEVSLSGLTTIMTGGADVDAESGAGGGGDDNDGSDVGLDLSGKSIP